MVLPQKFGVSALPRRNRNKKKSFKRFVIFIYFVLLISLIIIIYSYTPIRIWLFKSLQDRNEVISYVDNTDIPDIPDTITADKNTSSTTKYTDNNIIIEENVITIPIEEKCTFRNYEPPRHYNLDPDGSLENQPAFLSEAKYIRGTLPVVINPGREGLKKICMDTSEWETMDSDNGQRWPFSDGQNPSFVSLRDDPYGLVGGISSNQLSRRIDSNTLAVLEEIYGVDKVQDMYMGLLLFGDSQCRWNMTPADLRQQGFSPLTNGPSSRTVVVIMDRNRNPIGNAVLELVQDAIWGTKRKKVAKKMRAHLPNDTSCSLEGKKSDLCFERSTVQLDDARFFFHAGLLHVLFRNGPSFGYEAQVQHPVHIKAIGGGKFEAYIKASEMFEVCCGRNIAFISDIPRSSGDAKNPNNGNGELLALTWVDPVTVEIVNTPNSATSSTTTASQQSMKRRLRGRKKNKSHIHGTNGYLLPLHSTSELLGVAHFHRPENRDSNPYARFGHHYTHAFFTLQKKEGGNENGGDTAPKFSLKRLSNEFIFESPTSNISDGDIIQFASGLDLVGSDTEGKLLVSYGINDCESASFFLSMGYVQGLLHDVKDGDEVINLMTEIKTAL